MFLYICSKKKHTTTVKVQADQPPYYFMINPQELVRPSPFDTGGQCCLENVNPHNRMGGCLAPLEVELGGWMVWVSRTHHCLVASSKMLRESLFHSEFESFLSLCSENLVADLIPLGPNLVYFLSCVIFFLHCWAWMDLWLALDRFHH